MQQESFLSCRGSRRVSVLEQEPASCTASSFTAPKPAPAAPLAPSEGKPGRTPPRAARLTLTAVFLDTDSSSCIGRWGPGAPAAFPRSVPPWARDTAVGHAGRGLVPRRLGLDSHQQAGEMKVSLTPLSRASRFPVPSR